MKKSGDKVLFWLPNDNNKLQFIPIHFHSMEMIIQYH